MRLAGKSGIITAAASGMGRAGVERFTEESAQVAVVDLDADAAEEVAASVRARGGEAIAIAADLQDTEVAKSIVAQTVEAFGKLDFVWNHLGHPGPGKIEGIDTELLDLALDLNLKSVIATTEAAIPYLRAAGNGAICFTSSTAGLVGSRYSPPYSMMKHGVVGLTKALALQLAPDKIRVNAVCPGPIDTPMFIKFGNRPDTKQKTLQEVTQNALATVPLGRLGQPVEVANAVLFLLSDESSFITGAALPVDGGAVAR